MTKLIWYKITRTKTKMILTTKTSLLHTFEQEHVSVAHCHISAAQ